MSLCPAFFLVEHPVESYAPGATGGSGWRCHRISSTSMCGSRSGVEHSIAVSELLIDEPVGAAHVGAYRRWMGLEPLPWGKPAELSDATAEEIDPNRPLDLIVLAVRKTTARCQLPGANKTITLRSGDVWELVPGEIATVWPRKQWQYAGHPYLSADVETARLHVAALGLTPLGLESMGDCDPLDEYWGEDGEPLDGWKKSIIAAGVRPSFEMEQILPGLDIEEPESNPSRTRSWRQWS